MVACTLGLAPMHPGPMLPYLHSSMCMPMFPNLGEPACLFAYCSILLTSRNPKMIIVVYRYPCCIAAARLPTCPDYPMPSPECMATCMPRLPNANPNADLNAYWRSYRANRVQGTSIACDECILSLTVHLKPTVLAQGKLDAAF